MQDFNTIAALQGWSLSTQIDLLLEYIHTQQSDDAFNSFISEKMGTSITDDAHLGLLQARTELRTNPSFKLYKCPIGVFSSAQAEDYFIEYEAYVASANPDLASESARILCEEKHGFQHLNLAFAPIADAIEVDPSTLEEIFDAF